MLLRLLAAMLRREWRPELLVFQPTPYCNINCDYCYLSDRDNRAVMNEAVVDAICQKILSRISRDAAPSIVWHAGEPTVVPLSWYNYSYRRFRSVAPDATKFSIQTNGLALSEEWIRFLRDSGTRVSISLDGPERFHDARRKTRSGKGTWSLVTKTLERLRAAHLAPNVITVLHPNSLAAAQEFYEFYRDNGITHVSFSIDETCGANPASSFDTPERSFERHDPKTAIAAFFVELLTRAHAERYPLHVRDIERISGIVTGSIDRRNEQTEAWQIVVVAANGDISTFSPEFMELKSPAHNNFCFGNILSEDAEDIAARDLLRAVQQEVRQGVELCRSRCRYFPICGGGSPSSKMAEHGSISSSETAFCRLSIQTAADALLEFLGQQNPRLRLNDAWDQFSVVKTISTPLNVH
jgi:uncharacterized protein